MSIAEISGYIASALVFLTFSMKTMVPLRVIGICSNCAFIAYGALGGLYPVLILHLILLPMNSLRLRQMLQLTQQVREATHGDLTMDWLRPFTTTRHTEPGEVLFRAGDAGGDMFVVISGRYSLREIGVDLTAPEVVGELALLAPDRQRTQTLVCVEGGTLLQISYDRVEQLFFQNPKFGFYLLRLITRRLFENIHRLESELARCRSVAQETS
jgi:CRP-like cAMP-binding protein